MDQNSNSVTPSVHHLERQFWEEIYSQCHICYQALGKGKTIGEFVESLNGECVPCKERQLSGVSGFTVEQMLAQIAARKSN